MRIWDVSPGYLNRQSLLGEHRELHGLANILVHRKQGYARHPETLRWTHALTGLARRHDALAAEMRLRGYRDATPVSWRTAGLRWPELYVTEPADQIVLLRKKYDGRAPGRIPLPASVQQLWAQHKYSVMARDPASYRSIGRKIAGVRSAAAMAEWSRTFVELLRQDPPAGSLTSAVEHLWGYVSRFADHGTRRLACRSAADMLQQTQRLARSAGVPYLMSSTALSDLEMFVGSPAPAPAAARASAASAATPAAR